jgi:hypothetical protein
LRSDRQKAGIAGWWLGLLAFVAGLAVLPASAQTGIFSIFRAPPSQEGEASPFADAEDDLAAYVATGAPLGIRPTDDRLKQAANGPKAAPDLPVPPRRQNAPALADAPSAPAQAPPDAASAPEAAAQANAPAEEPEPSSDNPRLFASLTLPNPPSMQQPILPQPSTTEEIEAEEQRTPEPAHIEKQTDRVDIACLKPELMAIVRKAGEKFGATPVITSGQRSRGRGGSYHRRCMAADFFVPGVARAELARYLRGLPGAGGVGTYCHTKSVHIDIGEPRNWWQCGFRFRFAQRS